MKNKKGFTLVELLIVIVVIGVLSAMMMLSSTEAVSSAKAAKIINDMTQLKKATTAWYLENHHRMGQNAGGVKEEFGIHVNGTITRFSEFIKGNGQKEILKHINNDTSIKLGSKNSDNTGDLYILRATGKSKYWYVSYYLENKPARLKEKLAARAKSVGLVGSDKLDDDNKIETVYTNQKYVDMLILSLE
ncbi:MAG: type II secretion system protein [Synergistaceae bacterium]|nr:type II secretion system protein [Synergistaceae bacterium]